MKILVLATTILATTLYSCRPKPLDIEIEQTPPMLTLSSATPDNHSVLVSAGYSINSLINLNDTVNGSVKIPKEMLLREAVLTITEAGGQPDSLFAISDGLYGNRNLQLEHGATYTIDVYEKNKGHIAMATTTYQALPEVTYRDPRLKKIKGDTTVSIDVDIKNAREGEYYFISYNTAALARKQLAQTTMDVSTLASFTPKQLTLINGATHQNGNLEKKITMQVNSNDTLLIQTGRIDKAYFDYLTVYKKSGSLINQLTGEPINMPSNIIKGFGFFSLYAPARKIFYLANY
jgi:hypothetical protein